MYETLNRSLINRAAVLAGKAARKYPELAARAERAAGIIANVEWIHLGDGKYIIRGYDVDYNQSTCTCTDWVSGRAPALASGARYCKHVLAAAMLERIVRDQHDEAEAARNDAREAFYTARSMHEHVMAVVSATRAGTPCL